MFAESLEDRCLLAVLFSHDVDDPVRAIAPSESDYDALGLDWTGGVEPFDDTAWAVTSGAANGVGYDRGDVYDVLLGTDLEASMYGVSPTLFVRATFDVADPAAVDRLTLNLRYDDGYIVWLNGALVALANAATVYPAWAATATGEHQASTSGFDTIDLADAIVNLRAGTNVLAIRGLNDNVNGDDALVQFTLVGERRTGPPLAVDDAATTQENAAVTIDVLANDEEGSDPIDPTTVDIATPPAHGNAVVNANGTIAYTPNAAYSGEDSFTYTVRDDTGTGQTTQQTLVASNAAVRALVPPNDSLGTTWRGGNEPFNATAWAAGTFGVGYDTNPGGVDYNPFIGLNVRTALQNVNTTIYMRAPFTVADRNDVVGLTLRMRYDDGFAAFVNGVQVASAFAPAALTYNSTTAGGGEGGGSNGDANAVVFQNFNLTPFLSALRTGANVLAIHGLNQTLGSSDLLMQPELIATVDVGGRESNVATVTVNVEGVDFAPVADNDEYAVNPGTTIVAAPGVLANDTDADGDALTAVLVDDAAHGTLALNSDGGFTYTPEAGFFGTDSFTYRAFDGGVESNVATATITVALSTIDFGDAPLPYPTTLAEVGPRHKAIGPRLGATRDTEGDGAHSAAADGAADDDGVSFGTIRVGQLGATATVDVQNAPVGARLDAWIDFNADGSWGGPGEQIASGAPVVEGTNTVRFDVPSWATDGQTFARFRISTAGNLGVRGPAVDGEVEDYAVAILSPVTATGVFGGRNIINAAADGARSVFAADLDGDGDMDVLSGSLGNNNVAWYENDGRQAFASHTIRTAGPYAPSVFAADVDGDGDLDVLSASEADHQIAWYENNGSQAFAARTISTAARSAQSVFAADVDGDGDMDVLSASWDDDKIAWYENNGSQAFLARTISTAADGASSVFAADMDGDGDMDVLSAAFIDGKIAWYENNGSQAFFAHTITTLGYGLRSVFAADMDGDGDMDVLSSAGGNNNLAWYENDGSQAFAAHTFGAAVSGASVFAADMDGDGDLDVLSASEVDHKIAWYENNGSQAFTAHTISTAAVYAFGVFAADVDGDGDLDVLSASNGDDTIAWYENENPSCASCADAYSVNEDAALVVDAAAGVLANDGAQQGEVLAAAVVSSTSYGTVVLAADGSFTYTPNANYSGTDSFTYRVTSNQQGPRDIVVTITINPLPDAPVAANDAYSAESGVTLRTTATVVVDPTPRDETLIPFDATWNYLHPTNGQDPAGSDPDFNTTWQLGGAAYNGPAFNPPARAMLGYGTIDYGPITTNIGTPPSGSRYSAYFRRTFELTADPLDVTTLTAELLADDAAVIYLNGQRVALHNMPAGTTGRYVDLAAGFDVQGSSPESRTFTIVLDPAALVTGTNVLAVSVHNVTTDSSDLGFALRLDARIVPEPEPVGVLVNDSDADGDALVAELVSPPANGSLTLNADGTFEYTSNAGFVGVDTFQYRASDGVLASLPETATITVMPANRSPVVHQDVYSVFPNATLNADGGADRPYEIFSIQRGDSWAFRDNIFDGAPYPVDARGDLWNEREYRDHHAWPSGQSPLGYGAISAASLRTTLQYGGNPLEKQRTTLFRRGFTAIGVPDIPSLRFEALIDDGAIIYINGVEVARVNMPAGLVTTNALAASEGNENAYQTFTVGLAAFPGLLVEGSDNWIAVELHQDSPTSDDLGFDLELNLVVVPARRPRGVLANDTDADGDALAATSVAGPYHGTLDFRSDGTFTYTPAAGFTGVDQFTYRASDATVASNLALVTINVGDDDEAPLAQEDRYITWGGRTLSVAGEAGLLANDFDANGDQLATTVFAPPTHGTLSLAADGSFTYTPQANFIGVDTFTYRVTDDAGSLGFATATVYVLRLRDPINGIPLAGNDTFDVTAGGVLNVGAPGVLTNDHDPELRPIVATVERSPWHGSLSFAADGSFAYTPLPGFTGEDTFTYRGSDGNTFSMPATVTLNVAVTTPALPNAGTPIGLPPGAQQPGTTTPTSMGPGGDDTIAPDTSTPIPFSGDLNNDGRVDRADLAVAMLAYGATAVSSRYSITADLNADGRVSLADLIAIRNSLTRDNTAAAAIIQQAVRRPRPDVVDHILARPRRQRVGPVGAMTDGVVANAFARSDGLDGALCASRTERTTVR